jgi:plastocyanin
MTNFRNLLLTFAALAILPCAAARADTLAINFMPSTLSAAPGQTVTFSGTITNLENATVDLNSCDVNLSGPFTTDSCVDFLRFAPLFLGPLETSAPFDMFTATADQPFTGSFGLQYPGIFTVLGGPDSDAQEVLARANFGVIVTPEPGSAVLLGLAVILTLAFRRHRTFRHD